MEIRIAKIISYLFHPLLMPAVGIFLLFNAGTYLSYTISGPGKLAIYSIVIINTAVVPALLTWFQYRFGMIKSLKMAERKERSLPFFITAFFYFFCFYILKKNNISSAVCYPMLGAACSVAVAFIINFFWKISIHAIGIGGIIGMLTGISQKINAEVLSFLFLSIFTAGIIGFARLKLNAHSPVQVYAGYIVGFCCVWGALGWGI